MEVDYAEIVIHTGTGECDCWACSDDDEDPTALEGYPEGNKNA